MRFDHELNVDGDAHWPTVPSIDGSKGIEIVICTAAMERRRSAAIGIDIDFDGTELRHPKSSLTEFMFRLTKGYLVRVKEPPAPRAPSDA